jgi:biopolymer transport protein ExbD
MSIRLDHGEDSLDVVHEINATAFIDDMLVLLIILMIAAPVATPTLGSIFPPRMRRANRDRISRSSHHQVRSDPVAG